MPPTSDSGGGGEYRAASVTGMTGNVGSMLSSRQILAGMFNPADFITKYDRDKGVQKAFNEARWEKHSKYLYNPTRRLQIASTGDEALKSKGATGKGVNILPWTASIVGYLELLTGFGPPNEGNDLKVGAQQWSTLRDELGSAAPNEDWQGEAARAYAGQVAALQAIAQTLADLDGQLAGIVADQAEWVTHIRLGFGILLNTLTAAIVVEVVLRIALAYVPGGPMWATGWAILASSLAIAAALGMLGTLIGFSVTNANDADRVTSEFDQLAKAAAQMAGESTAGSVVSAASQSRVSDFHALSNGTSVPFAARGGGQSAHSKMAQEKSEYRQTGASETPESTRGQDIKRDDTKNTTMPSLGELIQKSKQMGNKSGRPLRRAGSLDQPDTDERAEVADTAQADGASAGTDVADRAPIHVAGQAEQTPPDQRSL